MKQLSFFLILFLCFFYTRAQTPFTFIYGDNTFENKSVTGMQDDEGNTYVLGVKNLFDPNAQGTPIEGYPVVGFTIIKLNRMGNKLWDVSKDLSMPDGSRLPASHLLILGDRIYVSYTKPMGWKNCGNTPIVEYDNRGLLCLDSAGNILFDSLYYNKKCSRFHELGLMKIGNTILSITKEEDTVKFIRTNENGVVILDSAISFPFQISAVQKTKTGIIVLGYKPQLKKIFITALDENFNVQFNKEIQTLRYSDVYINTHVDIDNNLLIMNGNELISISGNALPQWSTLLPYRCNVIEQKNNTLYQTYSNIDSNNTPVIVSCIVDKQGNILNKTILPASNHMLIKDIVLSATQTVYISDTSCCYNIPGIATKIHVSNTTMTPLNTDLVVNRIPELSINVVQREIVVFSKSAEKINFELINMNGERISSGVFLQGENILNIKNLSTGIYSLITSQFAYKLYIP